MNVLLIRLIKTRPFRNPSRCSPSVCCVSIVLEANGSSRGYTPDAAPNGTLLLMVLFENMHVFNSRSETHSAFGHNPLTILPQIQLTQSVCDKPDD